MMEVIQYIQINWLEILQLTREHTLLVIASVGMATLFGVPIGILIARYKVLTEAVLMVASFFLTIPSVALFGLMIPILSRLGLGVGYAPAVSAVFLYALLPVLRNTCIALQNLDPAIQESARGIGMTRWQRLSMVSLPISCPLILSGIRTAVVMNIGVMAIAAIVGAGGLGSLIMEGVNQNSFPKILSGSIAICLLALITDYLLGRLQVILTPVGIR